MIIWDCMSARGVGKLYFGNGIMNVDKYISVLQNNFKPQIEEMVLNNIEYTFQQDGAACHMAKNVKHWISEHNILLLKWTSSSPDLLPIETLWHIMKKRLRSQSVRTVQELRARLQEIWGNFTPMEWKTLVNITSRHIKGVLTRNDSITQW